MPTIRIAQIEQRSWGTQPLTYNLDFGFEGYSKTIVDVVRPWQKLNYDYHLYLIADDLCLTKLPFYIPKQNRIALLKESHLLPKIYDNTSIPLLIKKFHLILTHHSEQVAKNEQFQLLPYSSNMVNANPYQGSNYIPNVSEKNKLCSAIISIQSSDIPSSNTSRILRRDVIKLLLSTDSVDLFGRSTNPIANKRDALIPYAFSIAMENTSSPLYFTEKLIDCILTGAIPIYHGTREIEQYFDPRGIIFFDKVDELSTILSNLSLNKYREMRQYAETNNQKAINYMLCDYHGYLHRACSTIKASSKIKVSEPFKYSNSFFQRIMSKIRSI